MMKEQFKLNLFSILLISTLVISGCTSTKKAIQSWLGHTKSEIILSWGPPQNISSDGNGGEILIYGTERTIYAPIQNTVVQRTQQSYRHVYCNSFGRIYHIRWGQQ